MATCSKNCYHVVYNEGFCSAHRDLEGKLVLLECRNPTGSYNDANKAANARQTGSGNNKHYYYELMLLNVCVGHKGFGTQFPSAINSGDLARADVINSLISYINTELARRGLYGMSNSVASGAITLASIIKAMNDALNRISTSRAGSNPSSGSIMTASTDPKPVIDRLNYFCTECLCYSDCTKYAVCSCHGYCNNY